MHQGRYLERIGYAGQLSIDENTLRKLHKCHVMSIPFEALDIQLQREISLDPDRIFKKVVLQNRGGYCYELNYLFYCLLTDIGFDCSIVSARIYKQDIPGPEFDHMSIIVNLNDPWLVDVGYGDLIIEPLRLNENEIREGQYKKFRLKKLEEDKWLLTESLVNESKFIKRYEFNLEPRRVQDFFEQHHLKQNSPESYFVNNLICTIATTCGRNTLLNDKLKVREGDKKEEKVVTDRSELMQILRDDFDILLNE